MEVPQEGVAVALHVLLGLCIKCMFHCESQYICEQFHLMQSFIKHAFGE